MRSIEDIIRDSVQPLLPKISEVEVKKMTDAFDITVVRIRLNRCSVDRWRSDNNLRDSLEKICQKVYAEQRPYIIPSESLLVVLLPRRNGINYEKVSKHC